MKKFVAIFTKDDVAVQNRIEDFAIDKFIII